MEINYEKYLTYGLILLIIVILVYAATSIFGIDLTNKGQIKNQETATKVQSENKFQLVSTGSTGPGDVSVELTPHEIKDGKLNVDIAVNTHSVDLNPFDLKQITTLEYEGKKINPVSAPSLNGHHSSGTLTFEVGKEIKQFKIFIKGIPAVEERIFEWN